MSATTIRLAPGVPGLEALGAACFDDLMGRARGLATADRERVVSAAAGEVLVLVPLPGTPDERGVQHERPRGAGTGLLWVRRFEARPIELLRARLTRPRSTSLAAREWNLICHLQAHGVGAPQLVALGEGARGESFVAMRVLEGFETLERWLAAWTSPSARRHAVRSLGRALAALFRSGTWLPALSLADIWIASGPLPLECAALELEALRARSELVRGLQRRRLPSIALTGFRRGRILERVSQRRRRRLLEALARELPAHVTRRERLEVLALSRR